MSLVRRNLREMTTRWSNLSEEKISLQQTGFRLSPEFVRYLVSKFAPRTRKVTLDNFIVANIHIHKLTDAFRSRDTEMKGVITIRYEDFIALAFSSLM
ncbi:peflin or Penta-EF hand domain-containing protein 1 [Halocaridina rubra]|uniref:Peflin or Penta-EF hand domain-containing protein 1 n=1 Tax=Halocaridina rubra TaxID=373956 RepID=A0AAN8X799_HALRR